MTVRAQTVEEISGEDNVILEQLWRRMNFADVMYAGWFLALTLALLLAPHQAGNWARYLLLNAIILETIVLTAWKASESDAWQIAHDWYPLLLFIVGFEEVARLSLAFIPRWQDAGLLRLEEGLFRQPPTIWLGQFQHPLVAEVLEFGYFSFYWMLPVVGIVLYARGWKKTAENGRAYRRWMDALAIGYAVCFTAYLLFPTEGPAHTLGHPQAVASGPFRWLVLLIQKYGGVHGNAFPSGHIMAAVVSVLAVFGIRQKESNILGYLLILPLLLMCVGAVYDGYHYVSDVAAGALLGGLAFAAVFVFERRGHGVN